jgi:hypothetical protein
MTIEQLTKLAKTLDKKVAEGLELLETTPIDSPSYGTTLNNIIASTTLANKIRTEPADSEEKEN